MLPVECVVRGYLSGSGWKDYQATGAVSGIALPDGLQESSQLPEPIFTPSTKADVGHDEAIDFEGAVELVGDRALTERLRDVSLAVYQAGADHAREHGIILADTKFEFGLDARRQPDARRRGADAGLLALLAGRRVRARPRSAELRQAVRPRLGVLDRVGPQPAGPEIPDDIVAKTRDKYVEAYERITGHAVRRVAGEDAGVRARVLVKPKAGILDPQGQAVERALPALGFTGVRNVHVGRMIELDVEDPDRLPEMCERLLSNPLIEDYEIVEA